MARKLLPQQPPQFFASHRSSSPRLLDKRADKALPFPPTASPLACLMNVQMRPSPPLPSPPTAAAALACLMNVQMRPEIARTSSSEESTSSVSWHVRAISNMLRRDVRGGYRVAPFCSAERRDGVSRVDDDGVRDVPGHGAEGREKRACEWRLAVAREHVEEPREGLGRDDARHARRHAACCSAAVAGSRSGRLLGGAHLSFDERREQHLEVRQSSGGRGSAGRATG